MQIKGRYFIVPILFILLIVIQSPVYAAGSGGVDVSNVHVCLDGAVITGTVTAQKAVHRPYSAIVLRGHVGWGDPVYTGQQHFYAHLNEEIQFLVKYPPNAFSIGEEITLSTLAQDQSGHGGGIFTAVENCTISNFVNPTRPTQPHWISFAPDTNTANFWGRLVAQNHFEYIVFSQVGETLNVNFQPENQEAVLAITGLDDHSILLDPSTGQTTFTGILPSTQSYLIQLIAGSNDESFTLDVQIPWELTDDGYSLFQRTATNHFAFTHQLPQTIHNQSYSALASMMSDAFAIHDWQMGGYRRPVTETMTFFEQSFLPETAIIEFPTDVNISNLIIDLNLTQLFPDAYEFIYSRGWGIDGNTEAILAIKQDPDTMFVWDGMVVADGGFTPVTVSQSAQATPQQSIQQTPIETCNYHWFFIPSPTDCPDDEARVSNATAQYFEHGVMIWVENTNFIYVFYASANRINWFAQSNTWGVGMPDTTLTDSPPDGYYLPIRGFGLLWQDSNNRQELGWATSQEFAVQISEQCDDHIRTGHCYISAPNGLIRFGRHGLWNFWGA